MDTEMSRLIVGLGASTLSARISQGNEATDHRAHRA